MSRDNSTTKKRYICETVVKTLQKVKYGKAVGPDNILVVAWKVLGSTGLTV